MRDALVWAALFAGPSLVSAAAEGGLVLRYGDGATIEVRTMSTGANAPRSTAGAEDVPVGYDYHRVVFDKRDQLLLGYDIEAVKTGNDEYAIRIKPVDTTKFMIGGRGKWLEIPTLKAVREFATLRVGDAVQVDILRHPETGERIYDVLSVLGKWPTAGKPREATAEKLTLADVRLVVDGKTIYQPKDGQHTSMSCGALMIYLPRRGEFYFTLSPPDDSRFRIAGWVDNEVLRFHAEGALAEIISDRNILRKQLFSSVWVRHVPESPRDTASNRALTFHCGDTLAHITR